ncbi:hypothetical protein [Nocardia tengchongensis]|uniref:hypothetical protein n=1 Tax=Nocardia tengchongensis TaxID=2055889 RepID=UPI003615C7AF
MNTPAHYRPVSIAPVPRTPISQATAVEQSRAVAEVQAAVMVAQERPRNKAMAVEEMRDATAQMAVAEKAFFRYNRGEETVTGVSIHLARELARCWGNIDYGIKELRRDDEQGVSEMLARAWDMQTNASSSTSFIVPHIRDTKKGRRQLTETRDIYENNANNGARRLREQIISVLPNWFVEEAKARCHETLKRGDGDPLEERRTNAIHGFAQMGVTVEQLEAKVGAPRAEWNGDHLGQLSVIFKSIQRGEVNKAEEFPAPVAAPPSADELAAVSRRRKVEAAAEPSESGAKPEPAQVTDTAKAPPESDPPKRSRATRKADKPAAPNLITAQQSEKIDELMTALKVTDEDQQRDFASMVLGKPLPDLGQLTIEEGEVLIAELVDTLAAEQAKAPAEGGAE